MHAVQIYRILNHYTPREELDPGFEVLDNPEHPGLKSVAKALFIR
jgi:hypothetical protein